MLLKKPPAGVAPEDHKVTFDERHEFRALVVQARMAEAAVQVKAIRKGLNRLVSVSLLSLFSWGDLQLLIAGPCRCDGFFFLFFGFAVVDVFIGGFFIYIYIYIYCGSSGALHILLLRSSFTISRSSRTPSCTSQSSSSERYGSSS